MKVQRLRVVFSRGEPGKYITHLDLMRFWERALRRAGVPLAYSEGVNPSPRLSLAAPLPVGVTSTCELLDAFLARRVNPRDFIKSISRQCPLGIEVLAVREVGLGLPSLQSQVRWAEYRVEVPAGGFSRQDIQGAIAGFLAAETFPWQHQREKEIRHYDLRALVLDLWLEGLSEDRCTLGMRLRTDPEASGRAEQVPAALGFKEPPRSIQRTRLYVEETMPVAQAYRRRGQREG